MHKHIFRSYDIRGIVGKDLNNEVVERIGKAFGTFVKKPVVIGHDVRTHSAELSNAFVSGFVSTGLDITNLGLVTFGALQFYGWKEGMHSAFITASHLSSEWNGIKFTYPTGVCFHEPDNNKIRDIFFDSNFISGSGNVNNVNGTQIIETYIKYILGKMKPRTNVKVALDCGSGCAALMAPQLFSRAGFETEIIFGEVDGTFPYRDSQPIDENLGELKKRVKSNDIGFAFDGDADRIVVVDEKGGVLSPEETSYLILSELLKTHDGPVVINVECTRAVDKIAESFGRKIIRVPVGYNHLVGAINKNGAVYGVERSGHYCIAFLTPFSDCIPVSYYAAHALALKDEKLSDIKKAVPKIYFHRQAFYCPDTKKFSIVQELSKKFSEEFKNVNTMDGVRVDFDNGWVLIRPSNTSPNIRITVEGETEKDMKEIFSQFYNEFEAEMMKNGLEIREEKK